MSDQIEYIPMEEPIFGAHPAGPGGPAMMPPPVPFPENFHSLPAEEKYQFYKSLTMGTAGKPFASEEVARAYQDRIRRWFDVVELREPAQIPNLLLCHGYVPSYGGVSQAETFYDPAKTALAGLQFHGDFLPDYATLIPAMPGRAYERLGIKMIRWPGGGRPDALGDDTAFQYLEEEFMKADEYEQLIRDPEGYLLRAWYPRVFGELKGLAGLPSFFLSLEASLLPFLLMPMAMGPLRQAFDALLAAADSCFTDMLPMILAGAEMQRRWGAPTVMGGFSFAPFDLIGDTMRGTRSIMLDIRRRPDALIAACDALTSTSIKMGIDSAMATGRPFVLIPLHKGDDSFMSEAQFAKFYWPSFKRQMEGLIAAGLIPMPFVEGTYNNKLDVIASSDLPKGKTVWMFDRTDIRVAKKKLGGKACIGGNVPSSLFAAGTGPQMDEFCRQLIEDVAPGGGFFLSPGAAIDHANPETVRAFLQSTKKYGR